MIVKWKTYTAKMIGSLKLFSGLGLLLAFSIVNTACDKHQVLNPADFPQNVTSDRETTLQKSLPFPMGAAINVALLRHDTGYRKLVTGEFNSITPENAMKIATIHPERKKYDWEDADYLVDFADANKKRVHGHTLNWYKSLPSWVVHFEGTTAEWEALLKNHIQTVVGHFKGRIISWDVVNEAVNEDGSLRNSIWIQKLGAEYIERAFRYAHEADPDAILFYNDYGNESSAIKRNAILKLVNELKGKGVPIHGIGLQMHTRITQSDENLQVAISSAAATGLKVHISEIDIAVNPQGEQNLVFNAKLEQLQAQKYKAIIKAYNAIPKSQQFGITQWNVTDKDSWIPAHYNRPDWPLPFDSNYQKKAAYRAILDGVK